MTVKQRLLPFDRVVPRRYDVAINIRPSWREALPESSRTKSLSQK